VLEPDVPSKYKTKGRGPWSPAWENPSTGILERKESLWKPPLTHLSSHSEGKGNLHLWKIQLCEWPFGHVLITASWQSNRACFVIYKKRKRSQRYIGRGEVEGGASAGLCWDIPSPSGTSHMKDIIWNRVYIGHGEGSGGGSLLWTRGEREEGNGKRTDRDREGRREESKKTREQEWGGANSPFHTESGIPGYCQVTVGQSLEEMLTAWAVSTWRLWFRNQWWHRYAMHRFLIPVVFLPCFPRPELCLLQAPIHSCPQLLPREVICLPRAHQLLWHPSLSDPVSQLGCSLVSFSQFQNLKKGI